VKYLLLILLVNTSFADDSWKNRLQGEDQMNYYYLGISAPQYNKRAALDDSYNEAVKVLVKNNFGFHYSYLYEQDSNLEDVQNQAKSLYYRDDLQLKEVKTIRHDIEEGDGTYVAYTLIKYPKIAATKEKRRIASIKTKNHKLVPDLKKKKETKAQGISFDLKYMPYLKTGEFEYQSPLHFNGEFVFVNKLGIGLGLGNFMREQENFKFVQTRIDFYTNYYFYTSYRFQMGLGLHSITTKEEIFFDSERVFEGEKESEIAPSLTLKYQFQKNENRSTGLEVTAMETEDGTNVSVGFTFGFK
jgi:hypothetical protein